MWEVADSSRQSMGFGFISLSTSVALLLKLVSPSVKWGGWHLLPWEARYLIISFPCGARRVSGILKQTGNSFRCKSEKNLCSMDFSMEWDMPCEYGGGRDGGHGLYSRPCILVEESSCRKGSLDFILTFCKSSFLMAKARMSSPCRTLLTGSGSSWMGGVGCSGNFARFFSEEKQKITSA